MADDICPLCDGKGAGLPGYFGTMADMFTLLFAFFVLLFSMATMDPAKMSEAGGDDVGAAKEEEVEEIVEEIKKEMEELKEQGITEINDQPIEQYMDSLIQEIKEQNETPPTQYEVEGEVAEIIEEMELDSSASISRDVRGTSFEINGNICFKQLSAEMQPELISFLQAAADSFLTNPNDKRQIIVEGHTDNEKIPKKYRNKFPSNWELSSARASAVVSFLINAGVNPARLVAHGYADRWPADMSWADMRRGFIEKPVGKNVRVEKGRSGQPEYVGTEPHPDGPRSGIKTKKFYMDTIIDSLNSTIELRAKNRRIKIIFTNQTFVDGHESTRTEKNMK